MFEIAVAIIPLIIFQSVAAGTRPLIVIVAVIVPIRIVVVPENVSGTVSGHAKRGFAIDREATIETLDSAANSDCAGTVLSRMVDSLAIVLMIIGIII
jgi:hypothetical protein